jgi:hypothetical protein
MDGEKGKRRRSRLIRKTSKGGRYRVGDIRQIISGFWAVCGCRVGRPAFGEQWVLRTGCEKIR